MIPAFSACTESPDPGMRTRRTVSAIPVTSTSLCPAPTVSTNTTSLPAASRSRTACKRGLGEPAQVPARPHRADEDARIEEVIGEADAVTEERAVRERARRIDGDDADRLLALADVARRARRSGSTCPTPGGPVTPTTPGTPGLRIHLTHERIRERVAVLDERDRTGERPPISPAHAGDELLERQLPSAPRRDSMRRLRRGDALRLRDAPRSPRAASRCARAAARACRSRASSTGATAAA